MPELLRPASLTLFPLGESGERHLLIECGERHARTTVVEAELTHEYRRAVMLVLASAGIPPVSLCMEKAIGKPKGDISLVFFDEEQDRLVLLDPAPVPWDAHWGDHCPSDYFASGYFSRENGRVSLAFRIEESWTLDMEQIVKSFAATGKAIIKDDF